MKKLTLFVKQELISLADPEKAAPMAAYMKTDMPFYGVQSGERRQIARQAMQRFPVESRAAYEDAVLDLWRQPHREEKYIAVTLARLHRKFIGLGSIALYERLIREGAWWDFVDEAAVHLVGSALKACPEELWPVIDRWIEDRDMWIRRTALLCQNRHKKRTDGKRLFRYCLARSPEGEFFIRKAIGWALREYSKSEPEAVQQFLLANKDKLSALSFKEAARRLQKM
ncbi:MAG: DNA alkylation repair protein [Gemmatimonadota bacterium]|nr:DNA alkylation repair protein [Gemmatimonadota bacterium]